MARCNTSTVRGISSLTQLSLGSGIELEEGRKTEESKEEVGNVRATNETESLKFSLSLNSEGRMHVQCMRHSRLASQQYLLSIFNI